MQFLPDVGYCEDMHFVACMLKRKPKTVLIPEKLYFYRKNESSVTNVNFSEKHLEAHHRALAAVRDEFRGEEYKDEWDFILKNTFADILGKVVKKIENSITVSGIERCLKRHFYTTELLFKSRRINYRYDFDYKKLSPLLDNAINFAENAVLCVLNKKIDENIFEKNFLNKDLQPFNLNFIKK